jgi:Fe2+ transport system protein FeoA
VSVSDGDTALLRALEAMGLTPGVGLTVRVRNPATDSLSVTLGHGRHQTLGLRAAAKIGVEPIDARRRRAATRR